MIYPGTDMLQNLIDILILFGFSFLFVLRTHYVLKWIKVDDTPIQSNLQMKEWIEVRHDLNRDLEHRLSDTKYYFTNCRKRLFPCFIKKVSFGFLPRMRKHTRFQKSGSYWDFR